ncbi:autotransporter family protein [Prosthecobacter debontii]|uniref:autotransporter family protein n=1 Tax=Prosthecobacter debontii TaxID=48467 RepID=UPI001592861B|nr:autotransporter outer membrane beta-barrel domain-containing protein [Prosthecobacter debontii]
MTKESQAQTQFWNGSSSVNWEDANWSPDTTGAVNQNLSAGADVVFSVTGIIPANQNTVLTADTEISSLTINDPVAVGISGTGTLTISGTGVLPAIQVNALAGLVTIGSDLVLASGSDTIEVNNIDGLVISGIVSGSVGLVKDGGSLLLLSGDNIYTGATLVADGTLRIGDGSGGSIASSSLVTVDAGATLEINLADGGIWSNNILNNGDVRWISAGTNTQAAISVISGTGDVEIDTLDTVVLLGTNTYTGATVVTSGTLQVGDGSSGSLNDASDVTVNPGSELHINLAEGGIWSNDILNNGEVHWISANTNTQAAASVISGAGSMEITGTGTTILLGTNTFAGGTLINTPGTVLVGNPLPLALTSTAFGTGTLEIQQGTVDTLDGQILQINVGGFVQSGGELSLHLQGTALGTYTHFNVTGTGNLTGGIVTLYDDTGTYVPEAAWNGNPTGDSQTIIQTTGGLTGSFASNFPVATIYNTEFDQTFVYSQGDTLLYPTITYDVNAATVNWVRDPYTSVPGLTSNQTSVAVGLEGFAALNAGNAGGLLTFLNGQAIGTLAAAYELIAPEEMTAIFQMGFHAAEIQADSIIQHLDYVRMGARRPMGDKESQTITASAGGKSVEEPAPAYQSQESRWNMFFQGLGGNANVGSTSNAAGYDFDMFGAMIGADYLVNESLALGIMGGYMNMDTSLVNGGDIEADSYRAAFYGTYFKGGFYLDGLLGLAYNSYDTDRTGLLGSATGDTNGWEFTSMLNTGYDFRVGALSLGPVASVAYTRVQMDGFRESGSLAPLSYRDQDQESLRTNLGARISYTIPAGRARIIPQARVTWQHEFMDATQSIESSFSGGPGPSFTVDGPEMGRDAAIVTAGLTVQFNPAVAAYAFYTGQLARSNYESHNVAVGVRISF